ncbi:unnamed protein product, partial [Ectocarpus sp. 12 AP-2014]
SLRSAAAAVLECGLGSDITGRSGQQRLRERGGLLPGGKARGRERERGKGSKYRGTKKDRERWAKPADVVPEYKGSWLGDTSWGKWSARASAAR